MLGDVKADTCSWKCPIYSLEQICMDQARLLATKTARDKIVNCFCEEWYRLNIHRPFPHYAPVSKDKEMRTRLGWTISYKSPHFVPPSLELMPLFTGMQERSIRLDKHLKDRRHVFKPIVSFQYYPIAVNNIEHPARKLVACVLCCLLLKNKKPDK